MNFTALTDIQLDRGTVTNQLPVWNDTTKRFEVTLNPSGPASGIFGHWTRAGTTLGPAVPADTLRIDAIGPEDGTDDTLMQFALGEVTVDGDLTCDNIAIGTTLVTANVVTILGQQGAAGMVGKEFIGESGKGGDGPVSPLSVAGKGGIFEYISGAGGDASSGLFIGNSAGDGGQFGQIAGSGGIASGTAGSNFGGDGGTFQNNAGGGGDANGVTSGANTAGNGGDVEIGAADGGDATNSSSSNVGGDGGNLFIDAGLLGTGATANGVDGNIYLGSIAGNVRIGDTTVPTEALEVNGSIVQDESTGSRYLLRYSLMGA